MVARVLIINNYQSDLQKISSKLHQAYHLVFHSKSIEDAMNIVKSKNIDLVFVALPSRKSVLFSDDFSLFRNIYKTIPIIGLSDKNTDFAEFYDTGLDDIISSSVSKAAIIKKIDIMVRMKNTFDENLQNNIFAETTMPKKIVCLFFEKIDFLPDDFLKNSEIVSLNSYDAIDNPDLLIINSSHPDSIKCCAEFRLRKPNKYIPILLACSSVKNKRIKEAMKMNFECTDFIKTALNKYVIACRVNSLIRYKKLHEDFANKLKKSLYLSTVDSITEVYNRSFFDNYIKNKQRRFAHCAIVMIDIDKFKAINDKFGHSFADSMLRHISNTIKSCVRSSDIVARYGGDEFIIFMDCVSEDTALSVSDRIRKRLEKSEFNNAVCTVSIGVCFVNDQQNMSIYDAISIADKFMYIAKKNGGNAVRMCI